MMTKEAQNQIIANSFQDELFKIAAADVLGDPNVDWDNLSDEQLEKLAKWFPGKFLARGLGATVKGVKNVAKGVGTAAKATGKYMGNKFKDVGAGAKQVAEGVGDVAKGTVKGVGGAIKGTAGVAKDVVEGTAKGIGTAGKAVAGAAAGTAAAVGAGAKKWGEGLKEEFQTGAGTKETGAATETSGGGDGKVVGKKSNPALEAAKKRLEANVEKAGLKGKTGTATIKDGKVVDRKIKEEKAPDVNSNNDPSQTTQGDTSSAKPKRSNFGNAFAAARKAGKKEFTWNGRNYNTKMA